MTIRQFVVDAFTDKIFSGNPAAVCILEEWLPDGLMKSITRENNLSETAFAVREPEGWRLRWFTPGGEIDLCGHATLACGFVVMNHAEKGLGEVSFRTLSGILTVRRRGGLYELDFPVYDLRRVPVTDEMEAAIGARPLEAWTGRDLLCVLEDEALVRNASPDLEKVRSLEGLLLHITARGSEADCVSRSFAPKCAVPEDPVCGSGHCHIVPYWGARLGKKTLTACQASSRGGYLYCTLEGERIRMAGKAALFSVAELFLQREAPGSA